jgi:hypothetical protein
MMFGTVTTFQAVNLVVGVFLPILVALVTKYQHQPQVRAVLLLVLSGVSGVLSQWLAAPGGFDLSQAVFGAVTTFVVGVATLFGLWMPTGVNDKAKNMGITAGAHEDFGNQD